jgi:V/A-type H+-transporting ATPase subunit I
MVRLQVQVPHRDGAAVTRCIVSHGLMHLIDIAHGRTECPPPAAPDELLKAAGALVDRIRAAAAQLTLPLPEVAGTLEDGERDDGDAVLVLQEALEPIEREVRSAAAALKAARARVAAARRATALCAHLGLDVAAIRRVAALRFAVLRFGWLAGDALDALSARLDPGPHVLAALYETAGRQLVAIAVPASAGPALDEVCGPLGFEPAELPASPDDWEAQKLNAAVERAARDEAAASAAVDALRDRAGPALVRMWTKAQQALLLLQARTHFHTAGRFVVMTGWVPAADAGRLRERILAVTAGRAVVTIDEPQHVARASADALRIPILYRNPLLLRPFQNLVQLYGTPSYRELEPTAFFAVSFLLMFGLMFGDVGHGAVLCAAGLCLFRYLPRYFDYGILLMEAGTASIVFGVLYGSFFGIEGLLPVLWMEPLRDLPRFMTVAVGLGIVLVSAGLALNVVNAWRAGERVQALFGLRGLMGAFLYWVALLLVVRAVMPSRALPAGVVFVLAATAALLLALRRPIVKLLGNGAARERPSAASPRWLAALEGSVELVDTLFSYFANTISFVRVAAFAAVHAGVFVAMFALADTVSGLTFGGPLSIAALVAGNVVMILLEGLTVAVQVLRLEYYEFFGKFFRGGGELYRPLMLGPLQEPADQEKTDAAVHP